VRQFFWWPLAGRLRHAVRGVRGNKCHELHLTAVEEGIDDRGPTTLAPRSLIKTPHFAAAANIKSKANCDLCADDPYALCDATTNGRRIAPQIWSGWDRLIAQLLCMDRPYDLPIKRPMDILGSSISKSPRRWVRRRHHDCSPVPTRPLNEGFPQQAVTPPIRHPIRKRADRGFYIWNHFWSSVRSWRARYPIQARWADPTVCEVGPSMPVGTVPRLPLWTQGRPPSACPCWTSPDWVKATNCQMRLPLS